MLKRIKVKISFLRGGGERDEKMTCRVEIHPLDFLGQTSNSLF